MTRRVAMDGMTAAAQAAYALSEAALIFPITPASHMAETLERWSCEGRLNAFGQPLVVKEMQSEKGVAGALHGALAGGALGVTVTDSQGLLLMIPNLYKLSGELLPGVLHITCRSLSAHALSIFGDHQDLMAIRPTGVCLLGSASVQECMDLSLVAHLSAVKGSLPVAHFMDGFRTSDQVETIETIDPAAMAKLLDRGAVAAFRARCLEPERPQARGTAQNPDIYFQNREAANARYDAFPAVVQGQMDAVAALTGRSYHLFDYVGAPDAEFVIATMGSSCEVVEATVRHLTAQGRKVGLIKVRLYRPWDRAAFLAAVPASCRRLCALDRTKEPGSQGEPLYQDVALSVLQSGRAIQVSGGRYGLSSKDFTPAQVKAVFDDLAAPQPRERFTVGIDDDVTHLSLSVGEPLDVLPDNLTQAVFYGFGSDGTVSASKSVGRILGNTLQGSAQEYSWYDSKKSGGLTISYLRLSPDAAPIQAPWLIEGADYVACNKAIYVRRGYDLLGRLRHGGTFVLNCPWQTLEELDRHLPASLKRDIAAKEAKLWTVDASALAEKLGLGARVNLIMETVFFKLAGLLPFDQAVAALKQDAQQLYGAKGSEVVSADLAAIDQALGTLTSIAVPAAWAGATDGPPTVRQQQEEGASAGRSETAYERDVFWPMEELKGNDLPVSALAPDGIVPTGTTALEKRTVAFSIPRWDVDTCVECCECSFVCPHAAIRPVLAEPEELRGAPAAFSTKPATHQGLNGLEFRIQVWPEDCVGCGSCAYNCPAPGKALVMEPLETQLDTQKECLDFALANVSDKPDRLPPVDVPGTQLRRPLFEFPSCCGGCGEAPYLKLLTQLFGERLIVANATGCSSIYGAYMPAVPYCAGADGRGPAWGNSLFEDNGEYGYGIMKGVRVRRSLLEAAVAQAVVCDELPKAARALLTAWQAGKDDADASYELGQAVRQGLAGLDRSGLSAEAQTLVERILGLGESFGKKSVWCVGGDGWAYDIGYGGLDEVVASGEDFNVLVLDTEGYSNTGGEMSKATQLGAVTGFTYDGKSEPKKNLGLMLTQYGYVYVAHIDLRGDMQQAIDALREADAYDGPSVVICFCPCITWDLTAGMGTVTGIMKEAVETGYWPLWRFDPRRADAGEDPFRLDSPQPTKPLAPFLAKMARYASLGTRDPRRSQMLQDELAKDSETLYRRLAKQ